MTIEGILKLIVALLLCAIGFGLTGVTVGIGLHILGNHFLLEMVPPIEIMGLIAVALGGSITCFIAAELMGTIAKAMESPIKQ